MGQKWSTAKKLRSYKTKLRNKYHKKGNISWGDLTAQRSGATVKKIKAELQKDVDKYRAKGRRRGRKKDMAQYMGMQLRASMYSNQHYAITKKEAVKLARMQMREKKRLAKRNATVPTDDSFGGLFAYRDNWLEW